MGFKYSCMDCQAVFELTLYDAGYLPTDAYAKYCPECGSKELNCYGINDLR